MNTNQAINPATYTGDLPTWYINGPKGGSNQRLSDWMQGPLQEMKPRPDTAQGVKYLRLDRHEPRGKAYAILLLKDYSNKMTPNHTLLYP